MGDFREMTLTDIANIVLEEIGVKALGSIDGDDVFARKIKRRLPITIAEVSWEKRLVLPIHDIELSRTEEKASDGSSKFTLPRNILRIISPRECRIEGDFVLFNGETLTIKCTLYEDNPDKWNINLQLGDYRSIKSRHLLCCNWRCPTCVESKRLAQTDIERYMKNDIIQSRKSRRNPPLLAEDYFI